MNWRAWWPRTSPARDPGERAEPGRGIPLPSLAPARAVYPEHASILERLWLHWDAEMAEALAEERRDLDREIRRLRGRIAWLEAERRRMGA